MDRKQFMRDVYAKYWIDARDKKYGFMPYDKALCELLSEVTPDDGRLLEVAVGTGYPIADFLQQAGYSVYGIDISPDLVRRCRELNPKIEATVGDAENLDFADASFDTVYSFHSSWYFPNLTRVIDEMLRVTRPGGVVMFDIQNRAHPDIAADFARRSAQVRPGLAPRAALHARNLAKVLLKRGNPNWHGVIYEVPTDPAVVYGHLPGRRIDVLGRREQDQALLRLDGNDTFPGYARLVFVIRK